MSLTAVTRDKPPEIKGAPIAKWHTSEQDMQHGGDSSDSNVRIPAE